MTSRHIFPLCMIIAFFCVVAFAVTAQEDEMAARTGLRPDAPTYGIRGPHPVGTMEMQLDNEERPLPLTIWYPALNPDGLEESHTYPVIYPAVFPPLEAYGNALFEAAPDTENGPYPLVVWSHGFSNIRAGSLYLMEHLASWGFVVIAPDHLGMTANEMANEPDTFYPMYHNTPRDVSLVIDFAEAINDGGILAGMIDLEHIAASGHSSGGFTALQASGAALDLDAVAVCDEDPYFDCPLVVGQEEEIAALYGLDSVPEDGMLPTIGDDRIDVVIPLAGDQRMFGETGLNGVTIPTLYMIGTRDGFGLYEDSLVGFPTLGSDTAYMVVFEYADHGLFGDTCATFPAMEMFGFYDLCAEKVWDKLRAHDLINHYATAFLQWQLKGEEDASAVFSADGEQFPAVEVIEK